MTAPSPGEPTTPSGCCEDDYWKLELADPRPLPQRRAGSAAARRETWGWGAEFQTARPGGGCVPVQ